MIAFILIISVVFIIGSLDILIGWSLSVDHGIKIKFSAFQKFYSINPDRWTVDDDHVICHTIGWDMEDFHFGILDYIRYKLWFRKYKKGEKIKEETEIMQRMLKSVKADIEKTEREAKRYQDKAKSYMGWRCE